MTTTTFKRASIQALATRTDLYTCPGATTSIVFDGTVSNIDNTTKGSHYITIEVWNTVADSQGVNYHTVFKELEVPYGLTTPMPKIVMVAGEIIKLTCVDGVANVLDVSVSIIERT